MSAQPKDVIPRKNPEKRAYPGATLRHLGSVRDVTLAGKTHPPGDGLTGKRSG